jgi:hypothetical protein
VGADSPQQSFLAIDRDASMAGSRVCPVDLGLPAPFMAASSPPSGGAQLARIGVLFCKKRKRRMWKLQEYSF